MARMSVTYRLDRAERPRPEPPELDESQRAVVEHSGGPLLAPSGEVLGVIGPNGAGKSTLLKILSQITFPTTGQAEFRGRLSSLFQVGTGFHPELTGRENIYLSGAVLGMRKAETDRKFDAIVDFSGVERFIDTPVKRYSSGMYVRLAFAVAAHLESEVLLLDEVLAVGDLAFQNKCLGKIDSVAKSGRTVLFVSHSVAAVSSRPTSRTAAVASQTRRRVTPSIMPRLAPCAYRPDQRKAGAISAMNRSRSRRNSGRGRNRVGMNTVSTFVARSAASVSWICSGVPARQVSRASAACRPMRAPRVSGLVSPSTPRRRSHAPSTSRASSTWCSA